MAEEYNKSLLNGKILISSKNLRNSEKFFLDLLNDDQLFFIYNIIIDEKTKINNYRNKVEINSKFTKNELNKLINLSNPVKIVWGKHEFPDLKITYNNKIKFIEHTSVYCDKKDNKKRSKQAEFLLNDNFSKTSNRTLPKVSDTTYLENLKNAILEKKQKFIRHNTKEKIILLIHVNYLIQHLDITTIATYNITYEKWKKITTNLLDKLINEEKLYNYFDEIIICGELVMDPIKRWIITNTNIHMYCF